MRQEHKLTSKKRIILLSVLGIIPFYFELIIYFFYPNLSNNNLLITKGSSSFYGVLIISFLCGMHWARFISEGKVKLYILPMLPIIFLCFSYFFNSYFNFNFLVIIGLLWCLFIDFFFIRSSEFWYLRMRSIITFLAIIPLFTIIFIH